MQYIMDVFKDLSELKLGTVVILGVLFLVPVIFVFLKRSRKHRIENTRVIAYGGMCIALSFVLSYVRLYHWPQGGSVTLASMLPMFVFAYIFGPIAGIAAGIAYGFLQLIQDPYILHWAQVLLDYPLAFGAMGLAGLYRKNIVVSSLIGGAGRFFMHFLSGFIFFGSYAPEGSNVILYSLTVNGILMGTDTLICIVVCLMPGFRSAIERIRHIATA